MAKSMRVWCVTFPRSTRVCIASISVTRKGAIQAFCDNGDYSDPDEWTDWKKRGATVVRCTLTQDNNMVKEEVDLVFGRSSPAEHALGLLKAAITKAKGHFA